MSVEILLIPEEIQKKDITSSLVVIIDVLRASSTITTALAEGADSVIPVYSPEEAKIIAEKMYSKPGKVLLCGERRGQKLPGFIMGNSPLEYKNPQVKDKIIVLSTTNGIKAINIAREAAHIIIGCFLNLQAVIKYCQKYSKNILLVCGGHRGNISLEDMVCAGMMKKLIESNKEKPPKPYLNDDAFIANLAYQYFQDDLLKMLQTSIWGQTLIAMDFQQDLVFCAQKNIYKVVPILKNDCLVASGIKMVKL